MMLCILLLSAAIHESPADGHDGCDVLREMIRSNIRAAAIEQSQALMTKLKAGEVGSIAAGELICVDTARNTTAAFTSVLAEIGIPISWNKESLPRAQHCRSRDLKRCDPVEDLWTGNLRPEQQAFVHAAWLRLQRAVALQMPFGTANGFAVFTTSSLDAALSAGLGSTDVKRAYSLIEPFQERR